MSDNKQKNKGGFLGGLGYLGASVLAGVGGIGEGITDLLLAFGADITGNHDYAEWVFKDNTVGDWYKGVTEEYNPDGAMQFFGNVATGIGQSATLFIPYAGPALFYAGIGSQGVSRAAEKTGDVGVREVAFGALSGAAEGWLETHLGVGKIGKAASNAVRKGMIKTVVTNATEEFAEEFAAEYINTLLERSLRVDPNKQYSLKDALYAGAVGFVSGGIMSGTTSSIQSFNNERQGAKIIRNGNSQTLVNTATSVANKIAAQGTNFKNAASWVSALRGQVDAYNKLTPEQKTGMRGKTLLGEMQASLFFAEHQATFSHVQEGIQKASEQNRAAWAEYINRTVSNENRKGKTYTAADIANNTDNIAWQLAIYRYVPTMFNIDAAIEEDEIARIVAERQGKTATSENAADVVAETVESNEGAADNSVVPPVTVTPGATDNAAPAAVPGAVPAGAMADLDPMAVSASVPGRAATPTINEAVGADVAPPSASIAETVDNSVGNGRADTDGAEITAEENAKIDTAENAENSRSEAREDLEQTNRRETAENEAETASEETGNVKEGAETSNNANETGEEPVDIERAKRDAERMVEFERTDSATVDELNTAREYVRGFDNLPADRQTAIIRMMRSSNGVDAEIVKGVANLMSITNKKGAVLAPDLEFRFADGLGNKGGIKVRIDDKTLVLLNSDSGYKDTIRGSIFHEIVHYLENRKGYKDLAEYARKIAKPQLVEKIKKDYGNYYAAKYTKEERAKDPSASLEEITERVRERMQTEEYEALIDSEITAKIVGNALNSEKFLKRYANVSENKGILKTALRFIKGIFNTAQDKDASLSREAQNIAHLFDRALGSEVAGKKTGMRNDFSSKKITIGMSDSERYEVLRHRQIKSIPIAKEIPPDILKKVPEISNWDDINRYFKSDKKKLIAKIAKEFGAIGKTFSNEDIDLSFYFSGNNFQESYGKQKKNYIAFAKMFSVFDDVVQRAVGIDIHNRNDEGYKYDPSLENMYVLVSAYQDGEFTVPVKLEIKEFKDKQNALYVAISLGKIKTTEVSEQGTTDIGVAQGSRSVNISISQLFKKINPADKSFLKYIPKQFLKDLDEGAEQYDLDADIVTEIEAEHSNDEFFIEAVRRAYNQNLPSTEEARKTLEQERNNAIKKRKEDFEKLLAKAVRIQKRIEKMKGSVDESDKAKLKELKKQFGAVMGDLGALQIDLRQMGYALSAEQRQIERLQRQNENQSEQIRTLKQQKRDLENAEREDRILRELETREAARIAEHYAKEKAAIGEVFSESNIKKHLKAMLEEGLISEFFGGQYEARLEPAKLNAIARYIALQLNMTGSAESKQARDLIALATRDLINKISFIDTETGKKLFLKDVSDETGIAYYSDAISARLENIFANAGTLNTYAELRREFENVKIEFEQRTSKSKEGEAWSKEFPKTLAQAAKMKTFATTKKGIGSDSVQAITKILGGLVDESGHFRISKIDDAMKSAASFFEGEAIKLKSEREGMNEDSRLADDALVWEFNPELQEMVDYFNQLRRGREGQMLNSEELKLVGNVLRGMRTTLERYNKEYVSGRWVDSKKVAGEAVVDMTRQTKSKTFMSKFLDTKLGKFLNNVYFYEVLSPETVIESLEDFKTAGILKTMYHDIRTAKQRALTKSAKMKEPFEKFLDKKENQWTDEKGHKHSFRNKLLKKKVTIYGKEINLGEAIYLYMLTKREHSHLGLTENGYITYDDNGSEKTRVKLEDIDLARNELISQFDETDKAFIELSENFFNDVASKVKYDADMLIFGYSNNNEGYYVPIIRDRYSRMNGVTDERMSAASIANVYNKSFMKNLVRNNKALEGQNILRIIYDHADGLSDYAELYLPLKSFDRIYNMKVELSDGSTTSIRKVLNTEKWKGTEKYLKNLFADIQGQSTGKVSNIDKIVGIVRSGWVNSVLGANLKVVVTQTTSLGAATQIIKAKYITMATPIITPGSYASVKAIAERADKYSEITFERSFNAGAIKAQGNVEKVTDIGRKMGGLITWMDRRVCLAIFHAAELQIEAETGYKVGTEENATRAAKLADEAIYTTQAMQSQAERSALQREKSEIAKLFSMFTADTVKNLSHTWGNIMRWNSHKNRAKNGETEYNAILKKDGQAARRSLRTMAITGIMLALITRGFKYLYAKEKEEPEEKLHDLYIDLASSTLNVFPIISEFFDKLFLDYDLSINVLDVANDTLDAVSGGFGLLGDAMAGKYVSEQKIHKSAINIIKTSAAFWGIPATPIERTVTGLLRRFAPSVIYSYDAASYSPSYSGDLRAAVESGDEALAEHILETLYKNEATGVYSTPELEEIVRLYKLTDENGKHYDVLPQKISETVNDVKLTGKQRKQFESVYSQASEKVNSLIRSEYYYDLTNEQKAKAIKAIYALYYNRAAAEVAGAEWSTAQAYSRLTDNYSLLYAARAYKSGLTPYKLVGGKEITVKEQFEQYVKNLKLSKDEEMILLYSNGYRDKSTKKSMISYLNALTVSEDEKAKIAEALGLAYENGKITEKKEELEERTK